VSISPVDLAYAAGIVDGEGTVSIAEYAPKWEEHNRNARRKSPQFRCYLTVSMTDIEVPLWLAETFGGSVNTYKQKNKRHKDQHRWVLQNRCAAECAAMLLPYMKTKRRQAELLANFYMDSRFTVRIGGGSSAQLTQSDIDARREYSTEVRSLNQRGVS